jgi:CRP-like cAMP-binding protein
VTNRILTTLPDDEREAMTRLLQPVRHRVRDSVYRQGERVESVLFPLTGVFSLVAEVDGAPPVEVATVGREGFVGLPVFLQATLTGAHMAFSQIDGEALRMDAADFLDAVNELPALRSALQRYSMALMTQIARGAACNRTHSVAQRASRWLLQTHDRVDGDRFTLRRSFLAQMIGEDVGAAMDRLAAVVDYDGEQVTVRDRAGLERASCECYGIVRDEYDRLLSG